MSSLIFSDEEAKYVQAMLGWQDAADDTGRRQLDGSAPDARAKTTKNPAVGEFRILVVGAKGTGKTSILTRFATGTFRGEDEPPDTSYERGCRHVVEVDGQVFHIDALEMPSQHLSSNPMLEQALNITEAAMLVYDQHQQQRQQQQQQQ
ncbi:hypothetical protein VTK73DRAFT_2042 [Phialemonium thermophilum]|uniref:G domain-containing protein n=1 Tax=Phialemonium thermophilum TaxID=223376 RepID=A0ABR3VSP8_9PEZI